MGEIKWVKLSTDIFNNRKIRQIESLPEGDSIIVIWCKMLCLAGEINDNGNIYFTKEVPYTEEMLSNLFSRPIATVKMALSVFERFGMIEVIEDIYHISNWAKYQNVDGMERVREQTRNRVANHRERKRLECNVTCNATVTDSNATDIEEDKELEEEKEIEKKSKKKKEIRHKYGEYKNVLLSDEEYEKLSSEFPNDLQKRIEDLSSYVARTGKVYKSHLATIRYWARKDKTAAQSNDRLSVVDTWV